MSWVDLLALIAEEAGAEIAARIETRASRELGGLRITIAKRVPITVQQIDSVAPGKPKEAARALGVHPRTIYRVLQRERIIR